jgi:hypothetical protein
MPGVPAEIDRPRPRRAPSPELDLGTVAPETGSLLPDDRHRRFADAMLRPSSTPTGELYDEVLRVLGDGLPLRSAGFAMMRLLASVHGTPVSPAGRMGVTAREPTQVTLPAAPRAGFGADPGCRTTHGSAVTVSMARPTRSSTTRCGHRTQACSMLTSVPSRPQKASRRDRRCVHGSRPLTGCLRRIASPSSSIRQVVRGASKRVCWAAMPSRGRESRPCSRPMRCGSRCSHTQRRSRRATMPVT